MKIKKSELTKIIASEIKNLLKKDKHLLKKDFLNKDKYLLNILNNKTYILTYKDLKYDLGKILHIDLSNFDLSSREIFNIELEEFYDINYSYSDDIYNIIINIYPNRNLDVFLYKLMKSDRVKYNDILEYITFKLKNYFGDSFIQRMLDFKSIELNKKSMVFKLNYSIYNAIYTEDVDDNSIFIFSNKKDLNEAHHIAFELGYI